MDSGRGAVRRIGPVLLMGAWGLVPAHALVAQPPRYRLELTDRVGDVMQYRVEFRMDIRVELGKTDIPDDRGRQLMQALDPGIHMRTTMEYEQELIDVGPEGLRTFELRWRDYEFQGSVGGQAIEPPRGHESALQDLLAEPVLLRASPQGKTESVEYAHPRLARAGALGGVQGALPAQLPDRPVAVAEQWGGSVDLPIELPSGGRATLTFDLEHTLSRVMEGPSGPVAVIAVSGSYARLSGVEEMSSEMPMHLQASLQGEALFDVDAGQFISGDYEVDLFALHASEGVELQLTGHATGTLRTVER